MCCVDALRSVDNKLPAKELAREVLAFAVLPRVFVCGVHIRLDEFGVAGESKLGSGRVRAGEVGVVGVDEDALRLRFRTRAGRGVRPRGRCRGVGGRGGFEGVLVLERVTEERFFVVFSAGNACQEQGENCEGIRRTPSVVGARGRIRGIRLRTGLLRGRSPNRVREHSHILIKGHSGSILTATTIRLCSTYFKLVPCHLVEF